MNYFVCLVLLLDLLVALVEAQQRPRILEHPTDAVAAKEEPLTLNCKAAGRPTPEIVWFHNGAQLIPDERKVILPEGSLFFLRVMQNKREQDAGVYWCEARSSAGSVTSRNATLQIAMLRDEFRTIPPKNLVAIVGGPVVLPCSPPRGIPEPSVLWSKDGKSLDLGGKRLSLVDSGSLMISEVQSTDAGTYECSAQSMAGRRSAPLSTLKVLAPPTVVRGPHDTEVIEGEGLDLPCELSGDPIPTVSWFRENGNLPDGRSRILLDNTLRIEDTRPEDQGQYICKGQNEGGNVSITVTLHVYAVPSFVEAPTNVNTQEGETIKLPCRAQGRPHVRVVWDRVSQVKKQDEPKFSFSTARVKRSAPRDTISEDHQRIMEEFFPQKMSQEEVQLDEFEKIMRDEDLSKSYTRHKRALSDPEVSTAPTISNYLEINDLGELVLRDVTRNDQGWYACAAINEAGSVVKRVFVRVAGKNHDDMDQIDQIVAFPEPMGSHWGSEINVMITAVVTTSSSTLDVYWETSEGLAESPLTVYYRPTVLQTKNGIDASPRAAFKTQQTTLMQKEHSLNDLKPFTEYEIFVTVPKGLGRLVSNIRKRRTMPSAPSAPPTDIKVGIINTTAAFVRWSPPPSHLLNGELTGYKIQIKSNATNKLLGQMSLNATTQSVVINSLSPGGRYVARIAGATAAGYGPFSAPAALHMDPSFIIRPPKTDPASGVWLSGWISFAVLGSLGILVLSGVILAIIWARKNKRNMKAAYPGPMTGTMIPDKHSTMWLHGNSLVKPAHSLAQISEYAELTNHNGTAKVLNNSHPEPYATVTLQRGGGISDDSCVKCSASPSSSEYNAPMREPINLTDMLPPPPDHPYGTYHRPINTTTNMTIRSNPLNPNPISPQVGRRPPPDRWGTSMHPHPHHAPPPIPNFPHNWMQQQRLNAGLDLNPQEVYSENDYESGSVLYEQCFRPDERAEYFGRHGEPTEEFYRNVNREFYGANHYYDDDRRASPSPLPPGPAPMHLHGDFPNSNIRLLGGGGGPNAHESPVNSRKQSRSTASTQSAHSSDDSDDDGMDVCDEKWPPRARRSRSRSKSNDRKYRTNR